jgi:hypothetical protein
MAYIWTVRAAGDEDAPAEAEADADADADGLSVVADALADSLAAADGAAEVAAEGDVVVAPPPQAARIAPAKTAVTPKRARVVRVIGPPKLGSRPCGRRAGAAGHGRAEADAVWNEPTIGRDALQNRRDRPREP